jgi:hypothetical protein
MSRKIEKRSRDKVTLNIELDIATVFKLDIVKAKFKARTWKELMEKIAEYFNSEVIEKI